MKRAVLAAIEDTVKIQPGETAKEFDVRDLFGNSVRLRGFRGKKLMLSFYRYASCPLCNLRIHEIIRRYPDFKERGMEVVAVFQSPGESIRQYVGKRNAPFAIVPDPDRELYRMYGVEASWTGYSKGMLRMGDLASAIGKGYLPGKMEGKIAMIPADFLIKPDLIVRRAYYGKDIGDHLPTEEIDAWLSTAVP